MSPANTTKSAGWHDVQDKYNKIQDGLLRVKSQLNASEIQSPESIIKELSDIATLAQSISLWRSKPGKQGGGGHDAWKDIIDTLDREGVNLWNTSGLLRHSKYYNDETISTSVLAAVRLAAFRLIDAGLESSPSTDTLTHALQIASKTGVAIAESGQEKLAIEILARAAHLEQMLGSKTDPEGSNDKEKAAAVVCYYSSRMEVALTVSKDEEQAYYMLARISDAKEERLSLLSPHDLERLSAKILELGKLLLKEGRTRTTEVEVSHQATTALKWIQKSFTIVEKLSNDATPGVAKLKQVILRTLARAYYLSSDENEENLSRAQETIDTLLDVSGRSSHDHTEEELQQLRWMCLAILKKRKAEESLLLDACYSIVDGLVLTKEFINDVIHELRSLVQYFTLCTKVLLRLLRRALPRDSNGGETHMELIFVALLFLCSREPNQELTLPEVKTGCQVLTEQKEFRLPRIPCTACQSILWQIAEKKYQEKHWIEAAEWYIMGTHEAFSSMAQSSYPKCFRKAALCYIEAQEYDKGVEIIKNCPGREAATHYVHFLAVAHQGLEKQAVGIIRDLVAAPDFNRKMLFLATQMANETKMRALLLTILESLLATLKQTPSTEEGHDAEALTLLRCIVRLVLEMMKDSKADLQGLIVTLLTNYTSVLRYVEDAYSKGRGAIIAKDVAWLWRTAYNTATSGCSDWTNSEDKVSDMFELAEKLMGIYASDSPTAQDWEFYSYRVFASFACIAGRVFAARRESGVTKTEMQEAVLPRISAFKILTQATPSKDQSNQLEEPGCIEDLIHVTFVLELEILQELGRWSQITNAIEQIPRMVGLVPDAYEAACDILWNSKHCPVDVLQKALESILHVGLENESFSILNFSRWLRVVCTVLLARNTEREREKAACYIEDALEVVHDNFQVESGNHRGVEYPIDELEWLLSTAYNTGVECLSSHRISESKRWFAMATKICEFVPESSQKAAKVTQAYNNLLDRYAS